MNILLIKCKTYFKIGFNNILRVLFYRLGKKVGLYQRSHQVQKTLSGVFFLKSPTVSSEVMISPNWREEITYFSHISFPVSKEPPDWFLNPITGIRANTMQYWWNIPDFNPLTGDIKIFWEASRFDWVLIFAQDIKLGNQASLDTLNIWLNDWCQHNPSYKGVNWKCGQEASLRVMHLAMAALILNQITQTTRVLTDFIIMHLKRIELTLQYAIAQNNNHGTSEAAALFIGGSWLEHSGITNGRKWSNLGRHWLENRVKKLIEKDGSFSQYSMNYHRVMLDTLCMVEVWRRALELPPFSEHVRFKLMAASSWLVHMVDFKTGDVPNIGANDGANFLPISDAGYRDFRPAAQLAVALFHDKCVYQGNGSWNSPLFWFGIPVPEEIFPPCKTKIFDKGGYAVLRRKNVMALLRYPRFRFRPGQADVLHVDLWVHGENLLRDAGSYSYNTEEQWMNYFPCVVAHNTIQFDDHDQMPKLNRFLYGNWLKTQSTQFLSESIDVSSFGTGYKDNWGASHFRCIKLKDNVLYVEDKVDGFKNKAVLRWRLRPGVWRIEDGYIITDGEHIIRINSSVLISRLEMVNGWESRYYLHKESVPVLEVELNTPGILMTEYTWLVT